MSGGAVTLRFNFSVPPAAVQRIFDAFGEDLRDFTPAMYRCREVIARMFGDIFESEGRAIEGGAVTRGGISSTEGGWAPDSPETLRRKLRAGQSSQPLRATGRLAASLLEADGNADSIRRVSSARDGFPRLFFGSTVPYAAAANFGSVRRKMPARPLMGITPQARVELSEVLGEYIQARLDAAGEKLTAGGA